MDWPRFQLTQDEAQFSQKYDDPRKARQQVLRRTYYNELTVSPLKRQDSVNFQISRRCRVVGMTAAGDLDAFLISLKDASGEEYTFGKVHAPLMFCGWNQDNRSPFFTPTGVGAALPSVKIATAGTLGPFIFEPNIVLRPNQALTIDTFPRNEDDTFNTYLLGINLHVVEFPGMPGSPK